jgi:hypothetical protein
VSSVYWYLFTSLIESTSAGIMLAYMKHWSLLHYPGSSIPTTLWTSSIFLWESLSQVSSFPKSSLLIDNCILAFFLNLLFVPAWLMSITYEQLAILGPNPSSMAPWWSIPLYFFVVIITSSLLAPLLYFMWLVALICPFILMFYMVSPLYDECVDLC